jgi:hypothetical protein
MPKLSMAEEDTNRGDSFYVRRMVRPVDVFAGRFLGAWNRRAYHQDSR